MTQTVEATFSNRDCFLSSPAWQKALASTIIYDGRAPDRSEAVVTMWAITACAPALFRRATEAVLHHHLPDRRTKLAEELCALLDRYSKWREKWEESLLSAGLASVNDAVLARAAPTIYPQYLAFSALTNRFLVAIQPHRAPVAETNAINAALRLIEFDRLRRIDSVTDLCRSFSVSIGHSIKQTTMEWTMQQYVARETQTVEPAVFLRWNTILGRTVQDENSDIPNDKMAHPTAC